MWVGHLDCRLYFQAKNLTLERFAGTPEARYLLLGHILDFPTVPPMFPIGNVSIPMLNGENVTVTQTEVREGP